MKSPLPAVAANGAGVGLVAVHGSAVTIKAQGLLDTTVTISCRTSIMTGEAVTAQWHVSRQPQSNPSPFQIRRCDRDPGPSRLKALAQPSAILCPGSNSEAGSEVQGEH